MTYFIIIHVSQNATGTRMSTDNIEIDLIGFNDTFWNIEMVLVKVIYDHVSTWY